MTELQNEIEELLGPAVQVNDEVIRACQERNEFGGLSFALFKEAAGQVWVTCNAYMMRETDPPYSATKRYASDSFLVFRNSWRRS